MCQASYLETHCKGCCGAHTRPVLTVLKSSQQRDVLSKRWLRGWTCLSCRVFCQWRGSASFPGSLIVISNSFTLCGKTSDTSQGVGWILCWVIWSFFGKLTPSSNHCQTHVLTWMPGAPTCRRTVLGGKLYSVVIGSDTFLIRCPCQPPRWRCTPLSADTARIDSQQRPSGPATSIARIRCCRWRVDGP